MSIKTNSTIKTNLKTVKTAKKGVRKIVFKTHNLGKQLDNLKRADYYPDPEFP